MSGPTDFRTRAAQLANQVRQGGLGRVDSAGLAKQASDVTDPVQAEILARGDDAYSRRGLGGPIASAGAADSALMAAAARASLDRKATLQALAQRREGLKAAWGSLSAQEAIDEAIRKLHEEKRRRANAQIGELAGIGGTIIGTAYAGPAGGAIGGAIGKYAGSNANNANIT